MILKGFPVNRRAFRELQHERGRGPQNRVARVRAEQGQQRLTVDIAPPEETQRPEKNVVPGKRIQCYEVLM